METQGQGKAQSSKSRGGRELWSGAPLGERAQSPEPRVQSRGPTSRVPGLRKAQDGEDPGPLQTPESPVVASGVREEGTGIPGGPSGLAAAAAAAASGAAALYPHKAGLLLQNAAPHHLGQLLRVAPLVGGHLHPGAGQPPEHML